MLIGYDTHAAFPSIRRSNLMKTFYIWQILNKQNDQRTEVSLI